LSTETNTIIAVFIFLLAATDDQVDAEDVEDAALRPNVLTSTGLGRKNRRDPPPPRGLDASTLRPPTGAAPNHQGVEVLVPL
jgi:hypothetical protein